MDAAPYPGGSAPFAALYREHFEFVWRSVARLGLTGAAIDDAVQEVFVAAYRRLPTYDGRGPLRAWLFGIAVNVVKMARRAEVRHRRRVDAAGAQSGDTTDFTEQRAAVAMLDQLLEELDDDQRTVAILIEIEGMSPGEVADGLGISINTVYSRRRLARAHLLRAASRLRASEARWA